MKVSDSLLRMFLGGGDFVLYILLALSVVTLGVILERLYAFVHLRRCYGQLSKRDLLLFGQKRLTILATLGNNAPFIGLFGTVLGVIKAFHDLHLQQGSGIKVVMGGISEALVATAMGLLVAIPAVIAYNAFSKTLQTWLLLRQNNE
ncbi:MotA/TolQ/ExbB proton channel family protein [Desulfuromonas acetoxidans]|uniref:MotA/TolQ/ExbB proton channel n=1 Tax=Desulfuromonas acetoxidans (strain DSM 684 / 11070) TaxID=281689 RepID=Q1K2P5_DESA6|nr:MotA/TolQ/ExbB proton channel family protein [Desulfuromonas acetoxidans]EAT16836.1 MotA/TolQ/ExbB proton channel [Desulfuromonas acetoxidans DSM 684]MBF0644613.1 MotA/TolQ/ExbB proton channel family protein [Desulfuromonas acetoxidans]NVD23780.1 MotA/TolQ/ExbB proton channel family protein [Desulfuromonas acetoxidans]NVE15823.1 MotA/TolQ/ExbB proton channel family protein [Desulfuromonas acetoxidans]